MLGNRISRTSFFPRYMSFPADPRLHRRVILDDLLKYARDSRFCAPVQGRWTSWPANSSEINLLKFFPNVVDNALLTEKMAGTV
jgi:hypothetical protein